MQYQQRKFVFHARPWPNSAAPARIAGAVGAFTLVEMLVALGIIIALIAITMPAINAMQNSFDSTGADGMINAALATARTLAITNQQYVGVRFQKAWKPNEDPLNADQYMIFIIYKEEKEMGNTTNAFHVIDGYKPIKLPANMGVIDKTVSPLDSEANIINATTLTILFSPAGKLILHDVQTRYKDNDYPERDYVINTDTYVTSGKAMFVQDTAHKQSRNQLTIYNREKFKKLSPGDRYSKYIKELEPFYINAYTGTLIYEEN